VSASDLRNNCSFNLVYVASSASLDLGPICLYGRNAVVQTGFAICPCPAPASSRVPFPAPPPCLRLPSQLASAPRRRCWLGLRGCCHVGDPAPQHRPAPGPVLTLPVLTERGWLPAVPRPALALPGRCQDPGGLLVPIHMATHLHTSLPGPKGHVVLDNTMHYLTRQVFPW